MSTYSPHRGKRNKHGQPNIGRRGGRLEISLFAKRISWFCFLTPRQMRSLWNFRKSVVISPSYLATYWGDLIKTFKVGCILGLLFASLLRESLPLCVKVLWNYFQNRKLLNFRVLGYMEGIFSDSILPTLFSVGKDKK